MDFIKKDQKAASGQNKGQYRYIFRLSLMKQGMKKLLFKLSFAIGLNIFQAVQKFFRI